MRNTRFIVHRHLDGYVAFPVGLKGVIIGDGKTRDKALADAKSALDFHLNSFGE